MKIGPVDTEIALLIVKKEEINASKIDSPSGKFAERAIIAALEVCTRHVPAHRAGPPLTQTDRLTDVLSNRRAAAELYYIAGIQRAHTHARQPSILDIACVHTHT